MEASATCLLYSTITVSDSSTRPTINFSRRANCNFPIFVSVIGCIVYALGMGIYNSYTIYKSQRDPSVVSQMWALPFIFINTIGAFLVFICSCIISVGFKKFCDSLMDKPYMYSRCSKAQELYILGDGVKQTGSLKHFYTNIHITQTASWICTLCWILLVVSGIIRFVRDRRHQIRTRQDSDDEANIGEESDTGEHHEALSVIVEHVDTGHFRNLLTGCIHVCPL